ncbi:MAG TPA: GNAT family N-acetyltransferase [Coleofasciculaceae cyanobacterium]
MTHPMTHTAQPALAAPLYSGIALRDATPEDVPALMDLLYLKAEFDGAPGAIRATPEQLAEDLFGDRPLLGVILAEQQGTLVGFATYYRIYSSFLARPGLWLDDLFLQPSVRGYGLGKAILQRLCHIAAETGCARIDWTVDIDNAHGIGFYQAMGAVIDHSVRLCRLDQSAIHAHLPHSADLPRPAVG